MPVLPPQLERELEGKLHKILRSGAELTSFGGRCKLSDHDAEFTYELNYQNYHRKGDVEHGVEVIFELRDAGHLVESDVEAIGMALTRLLQSTLSFDGTVDMEREPERYVFIDEIIHSFGERA